MQQILLKIIVKLANIFLRFVASFDVFLTVSFYQG